VTSRCAAARKPILSRYSVLAEERETALRQRCSRRSMATCGVAGGGWARCHRLPSDFHLFALTWNGWLIPLACWAHSEARVQGLVVCFDGVLPNCLDGLIALRARIPESLRVAICTTWSRLSNSVMATFLGGSPTNATTFPRAVVKMRRPGAHGERGRSTSGGGSRSTAANRVKKR
jgi:hypothetical protein